MEKSIFEQIGGTYHKQGDHFLPDLAVPESEKTSTGVWGQRHLWYIREHYRGLYAGLQLSGKLGSCLADIDQQAEDMFLRLVDQIARRVGMVLVLLGGVVRHSEKAHRASRHLFHVQEEKAADRSRANPKEHLQYLAAGIAGTAPQDAGYGTITDRAAG